MTRATSRYAPRPNLETDCQLTEEDVSFFTSVLGPQGVVRDADDLEPYNTDWMRKFRGRATVALKPKTTEQVSKLLKYCNDNTIAVVPQGGNSGLVGGSTPVFDEVVINLQGMNKIRSFDNVSGVLVADAGCILENADNFLAEHGYLFPLDLGAKGSCQIGGNVATAAGGLRLLRYGSLHGTVIGLEVVLADGTVLNNLSTLRKDNTGFDLKQLFIGSEGTIGIITAISILCPQRPAAVNVAFFALSNYENVLRAFTTAKQRLGEILSAFELMDHRTQDIVKRHGGSVHPIEGEHPFFCLLETSGSNKDHDDEKLGALLEEMLETGIIEDGVVAQDETQIRNLWACREGITECLGKEGGTYKYDMSLPLADLYKLVDETRERLDGLGLIGPDKDVVDVVGYGHMGDGNIHLNVPVRRYDKSVEKALEPFVYEWVAARKGSISAEHGLGLLKRSYVHFSKSPEMIDVMKKVKNLFDPNAILSPYKYLP